MKARKPIVVATLIIFALAYAVLYDINASDAQVRTVNLTLLYDFLDKNLTKIRL